MTARAETVVESVGIWEKSVFERLQQENSPELSESLQKAKGVYTQLRNEVDVILERIDKGLARTDAT